jgi:DNA processing protein
LKTSLKRFNTGAWKGGTRPFEESDMYQSYGQKAELLALSKVGVVSGKCLRELLSIFGTPAGAWDAIRSGEAVRVLSKERATRLRKEARAIDPQGELDDADRAGISLVEIGESQYPKLLAEIHDPPLLIFFRGALPFASADSVAVVGSRRASQYGIEVSRRISGDLAGQGIVVVSGAAYGIDSSAHVGAMEGGGATVAVLGNGVDVAYPRVNARLLEKIAASGGCLLSEYPPGTPPRKRQFPARNRIIAGISRAVLVVEAARESGALITVGFALEEGRDVMAVPGDIFRETSEGTNSLIRSGAVLTTGSEDIFEELGFGGKQLPAGGGQACGRHPGLSAEEQMVVEALPPVGVVFTAGDVAIDSGLPARKVLSAISRLEVAGIVRACAGGLVRAR